MFIENKIKIFLIIKFLMGEAFAKALFKGVTSSKFGNPYVNEKQLLFDKQIFEKISQKTGIN